MKKRPTEYGAAQTFVRAALNSNTDDCVLWPYCKMAKGYGRIRFGGDMFNVHRLICILDHGQPPTDAHEAAHSCGVPSCVNPRHLRWATPVENAADRVIHGTDLSGERNGRGRLTTATAREILESKERGKDLAARFGVSPALISRIRHGQKWRRLHMP